MSVLLNVLGVSKTYGGKPLFAGLSLDLREGDRIGLIGPNGAGKSTLLRVLSGSEDADDGTRAQRRGSRVAFLTQDDVFPAGQSVRGAVRAALEGEALEEHERQTRASIVLTQTGFVDDQQQASQLSGGWRKRLSIACAVAKQPDLLLMDEPTNHLDLPGIVWLERLLRAAPFGYVVATHDRAFLRAVADEVVEISRVYPEGVFRVKAGYDEFLERREEFLEGQAAAQATLANTVRRETEWLGRKAAARTRKAASRIDDAARNRETLADLRQRNAPMGAAGIDFVSTGRQSRKLLAATGLAKSLGGKALFSGVDVLLSPGTKLGLLGANGSGKSTLLRVLGGEVAADEGTVTRADGLRVVMFEQGRANLNLDEPLRKALCAEGESVLVGERRLHVVAWAKQFLFRVEQLETPVGKLSGGEQARVRIAQLMLQPADVLLLDEPTNDLDIPALEVLEDSLAEFPGAVVLVSHDRALMDRLCTEVVGLDGKGGAATYASVSQWLTALERSNEPKKQPESTKRAPAPSAPKPKKLSWNEQKEWEGMEAVILAAEEAFAVSEEEVGKAVGHVALAAACEAMEAARQQVERLYARWQELEAKKDAAR